MDKHEKLLDSEESQYRVKSNINTGHSSFEPIDTEEGRKMKLQEEYNEKYNGDEPEQKRTYSLATQNPIDDNEILEHAKKVCKQPIKLSWTDVVFEVDIPATRAERRAGKPAFEHKVIVKNVTGYAPPGQATYIMGASGAGKTSLLNILADRIFVSGKSNISGNLWLNDTLRCNQESFSRFGSYVMQDDVLFSHFTVLEALTFSARLKLKTSYED